MVTVWVTNQMLRRNSANNIRVLVLSGINVVELILFSVFGILLRANILRQKTKFRFQEWLRYAAFSVDNFVRKLW